MNDYSFAFKACLYVTGYIGLAVALARGMGGDVMCMLPETELTCCHGQCNQGRDCPRWGRTPRQATDEALDAFGPAPRRFINYVPCAMFVYEWLADVQWFAVARAAALIAGLCASVPAAWFLTKLLWAWVVSTGISLP